MSKRPLILVSASHDLDPLNHEELYVLTKTYSLAVTAGGGLPVLAVSQTQAAEFAELADGLVLSGGWPIHPDNFKNPLVDKKVVEEKYNQIRQDYDIGLFHAFRDKGKPILGICLGHQMTNIAQGGDLLLDIPGTYKVEHSEGTSHPVRAEPDSVLAKLFGENFWVNSHHRHYANKLGNDLKITAWSPEGIPEALEHISLPILGVQWHPERQRGEIPNCAKGPDMTKLFEYFVNLCVQGRA
jgi:putative glutamine amidotransferase